jgi:hypothetical protein
MALTRKWATFALILVCLAAVHAVGGGRAAMVIDTQGENLLMIEQTGVQVRTLQVLSAGSSVRVGKGAVLRLSFFKSGQKETITGPCTIALGLESSQQIDGPGKIEVRSARDASTDLDESSNLRRTGGAMQANSTELVSENTLAFVYTGTLPPMAEPTRLRNATLPAGESENEEEGLEFVEMSYAYLTPEDAKILRWNQADAEKLELYHSDGPVFADRVQSALESEIPVEYLIAGETHLAVLRGPKSATQQYFRILSSEEAREYRKLEKEIRDRDSDDQRRMHAELLYLNIELGLLSKARAVAEDAVDKFPNDESFRAALDELNEKLRVR